MSYWKRQLILNNLRFRLNVARMYGYDYADRMYQEALWWEKKYGNK